MRFVFCTAAPAHTAAPGLPCLHDVEAVLQRQRQHAHSRAHRVAAAHPVPEAEGVLRVDAEPATQPGSASSARAGTTVAARCEQPLRRVAVGQQLPCAARTAYRLSGVAANHSRLPSCIHGCPAGVGGRARVRYSLLHELEVGRHRHHVLGHAVGPCEPHTRKGRAPPHARHTGAAACHAWCSTRAIHGPSSVPRARRAPSRLMSQERTVRALSMVSAVVKVLLTTTTSVVSGSSPSSARATSMGSTLARKRSVRSRLAREALGSVLRGAARGHWVARAADGWQAARLCKDVSGRARRHVQGVGLYMHARGTATAAAIRAQC